MSKVLILSLSLMSKIASEENPIIYSLGKSTSFEGVKTKTFEGVQTNEAAAKLCISECNIDRIICLVTYEVFNNKISNIGDRTTFGFFTDRINQYCKEIGKVQLQITPLKIYRCSEEDQGVHSSLETAEILEIISANIDNNDEVFIDTTGGARDGSVLIQLLMKYRQNFSKMQTKALYSYLNSGTKTGTLNDVTEVYSILDMIDAVSVFTETGNCKRLRKLCNDGSINKKPMKKAVNTMDSFSSSLAISNIADIDTQIEEMRKKFDEIDKMKDKKELKLTPVEYMFSSLVPLMKNELFPDGSDSILGIIKWCLNNGMIQQALTLFVEKIPKYIFVKGFITQSPERKAFYDKNKNSTNNSIECDMFYTDMTKKEAQQPSFESAPHEKDFDRITNWKYIKDNQQRFINNDGTSNYAEMLKYCYKCSERLENDDDLKILAAIITRIPIGAKPPKTKSFQDVRNDYITSKAGTKKPDANDTKETDEKTKKLEFIKTLNKKNFNGYGLRISIADYKKLFCYYVYFKDRRNHVNHAAEKNEKLENSKFIGIINEICPDIDFQIDSDSNNMRQAVDFISELKKV